MSHKSTKLTQKQRKKLVDHKNTKMQGTPFFEEQLEKMEDYLTRLGYASETTKGYINNLNQFFSWMLSEEKEEINQEILFNYNEYLHKKPIVRKTIQRKLHVLKLYDTYLQKVENRKILTKKLEIHQIELETPREILTQEEIKKLYNVTEESILGLRDRAILSIYYGCGLRNREGRRIELQDINYKTGILEIKPSKNYQNRHIPLSNKVKEDLLRYQKFSRPNLINRETNLLLLNNQGNPIKRGLAGNILKKLAEIANIEKRITLHILRHSIATHLLQQGMQIEQISQFLGHKELDTTQKYAKILTKSWKN